MDWESADTASTPESVHPSLSRLVGVGLDGHAECAAQAQVGHLQDVGRLVHQQVLGLQVPVHHTVAVHVGDAQAHLVHKVLVVGVEEEEERM